ncbi:1-phosphofructokinase [Vibrio sp. HA2012]|uniref:1-phosphofructokinase family hexose kinase n=1 Tax=Vibrio sp. HA2012 TaxID=1971595 RepID=UPI000C2C14A5|nr:1-phosphofructokinase family hexose kinase [Vibrio sp. HA2012]PJC86787.1 1-phosphofructokinase [Vibrio sp. HA2012]
MIYTLTLNTAIDMNIQCRSFEPDCVIRTDTVEFSPNGKGINVSLVLDKLNVKNQIVGVFGGFTGRYILDQLANLNIPTKTYFVDHPTRVNVFINDYQNEYKLVNPGSYINQKTLDGIYDFFRNLTNEDTLVVSGSLPPGVSIEFIERLVQLSSEIGFNIILDISDKSLTSVLKHKPLLIKPNDEELESVFGLKARTTQEAIDSLKQLHDLGAQNVLLTLGSKGMYFSNGTDIYFATAAPINLISSTCAGDATLAAFLSHWLNAPDNIVDALKLAGAVGADVAASSALGELARINQLIHKINVTCVTNTAALFSLPKGRKKTTGSINQLDSVNGFEESHLNAVP